MPGQKCLTKPQLVLASASPARLSTLQSAGVKPLVLVSEVDEESVLQKSLAYMQSQGMVLSGDEQVLVIAHAKAVNVAKRLLCTDLSGLSDYSNPRNSLLDGKLTSDVIVVLGCDSMLERPLDKQNDEHSRSEQNISDEFIMTGKPKDANTAIAWAQSMRKQSARLCTGHTLVVIRKIRDDSTKISEANSSAETLNKTKSLLDLDLESYQLEKNSKNVFLSHLVKHLDDLKIPDSNTWSVNVFSATESTMVHFGDPTDQEICDYVATGEPIQVAGGFTIDALGGWFIDGISGCHHSVVGVSLPLVRRLLKQAGISVTDMWNVHESTE